MALCGVPVVQAGGAGSAQATGCKWEGSLVTAGQRGGIQCHSLLGPLSVFPTQDPGYLGAREYLVTSF